MEFVDQVKKFSEEFDGIVNVGLDYPFVMDLLYEQTIKISFLDIELNIPFEAETVRIIQNMLEEL